MSSLYRFNVYKMSVNVSMFSLYVTRAGMRCGQAIGQWKQPYS